jgi:acyl-CoA thioester hydrolase
LGYGGRGFIVACEDAAVTATTWSAPVRYAEVDGQGVVFNSHYLLYCDEAMALFCREHGVAALAEQVRLVSTALTWTSGATWGETVGVVTTCTRIGTSSFELTFAISADRRPCCTVVTTYVLTDDTGRPAPLTDEHRTALQS